MVFHLAHRYKTGMYLQTKSEFKLNVCNLMFNQNALISYVISLKNLNINLFFFQKTYATPSPELLVMASDPRRGDMSTPTGKIKTFL